MLFTIGLYQLPGHQFNLRFRVLCHLWSGMLPLQYMISVDLMKVNYELQLTLYVSLIKGKSVMTSAGKAQGGFSAKEGGGSSSKKGGEASSSGDTESAEGTEATGSATNNTTSTLPSTTASGATGKVISIILSFLEWRYQK